MIKTEFTGSVRPAEAGDLAAIIAIDNSVFDGERRNADRPEQFLQNSLLNPRTVLLLAFSSAANEKKRWAGGYVLGKLDEEGHGQIVRMAIMGETRNPYMRSDLLDHVCASLRDIGALRIKLEVRKENEHAISLYEKRGFKKTSIVPDLYGRGEDGVAMIREYGPESPDWGGRPMYRRQPVFPGSNLW